MRFRDQRQTLLKEIDTPDPEIAATPRWISARASGFVIAFVRKVAPPTPLANRRSRRAKPAPKVVDPWSQ